MIPLTLYHGQGKVEELVLWYILPTLPKNVSIGQIMTCISSSVEDTNPLVRVA